ncbi:MAG: UDP-3-O-(3-hydroxymyristoyl)glucosamine N-acyltransferase, partial [Candidatus Omnitrophica bacterium]|nr:UDP-3-O-(3-hydroxymyristoyl)glucosamine N-acyltransferase [Candidatus Omnitrophota bacterium]
MPKKVKEIAELLGGELVGSPEVTIKGVNGINEAKEGELAFILNPKHEALIDSTKASCVVVPKDIKRAFSKPTIKVDNPSIAFSKIIEILLPGRIPHPRGVHASAIIQKNAVIAKTASLGAYVVVEEGASIGDGTVIYPFCYIGKNTRVGKNCVFYPNVTIREEVLVGDRVIMHPGTVIGSDGFGYDIQPNG